jgi:hypothetical protein
MMYGMMGMGRQFLLRPGHQPCTMPGFASGLDVPRLRRYVLLAADRPDLHRAERSLSGALTH